MGQSPVVEEARPGAAKIETVNRRTGVRLCSYLRATAGEANEGKMHGLQCLYSLLHSQAGARVGLSIATTLKNGFQA